jgi:MinD superfamily P-loop ATPase
VTLVKQRARLRALDENRQLVIVDGPPGIGCPVISAASGADLALIVAEPSAAGIHDMKRILQTTEHFHLPSLVCINKADIYLLGTKQIEAYCWDNDFEIAGRIPFDEAVTEAMVHGEPVTAFRPGSPASQALKEIWLHLQTYLDGNGGTNE